MKRRVVLLSLALASCAREPDPAQLFGGGDYEAAARAYAGVLSRDPASPVAHYNLGAALIRAERYDDARPHLEIATRAGDRRLRQWAFYNLGNSDLEPAFAGAADPVRGDRLRRAIEAYKRALLLDPRDMDAKWNLELARRLLEQPPPERAPQGGGGGGEGGGGGGESERGRRPPRPQTAREGGPQPELSREAAEEILDAAEERELGIQREKLRKAQPPNTAH